MGAKMKLMRNFAFVALTASVLGSASTPSTAKGSGKAIVVVVSKELAIDDIPSSTLRRVFSAEPTETGEGGRFVPLNQEPGTPNRVQFDKVVLRLEPAQVSQFWVDQRIRGGQKAPRSIPSEKLLLQLLPKVPGAIAYVTADDVGPSVKVLKVDGKKPGEAGYPLQ
jgi:hypothetical protein